MSEVISPIIFKLRLIDEMPAWKRYVWRLFGKKRVGVDDNYRVTGYEFRGLILVWEMKEL